MASTNQTTHYELSQYISSDKPTYLTDYNQDMQKIDAGIYGAKSEADTNASNIGDLTSLTTSSKSTIVSAINEVNTGASAVGTLSNLTTTDKTSIVNAINEVNGKANTIGSLLNLTTTDKTSVVDAINEVKSDTSSNAEKINNFNLSVFDTLDIDDMSSNDGTLLSNPTITIAKNSDASLAKIYGHIAFTATSSGTCTITIANTGLAPSSNFTINNAGFLRRYQSGTYITAAFDIDVNTDGTIDVKFSATANNQGFDIWLLPMLYWITNFGDTPINNS